MKLSEFHTKLKNQENLKVYCPTERKYYYIVGWNIDLYKYHTIVLELSNIPSKYYTYSRMTNFIIPRLNNMEYKDYDILFNVFDTNRFFRPL
jgi:hypothetical protein